MAGFDLLRKAAPTRGVVVLNPADRRFRREVKKAIMGAVADIETADDVAELKLTVQPWQLEALGYRHRLGEIRYASDFYARPLRRLKFFVGEIVEGKIVPSENQQAQAILARVRDPGGGTQGLLTQYGRLMFCTGEALLLFTPEGENDKGEPMLEQWEMLSTAELRPTADGMMRFPYGGMGGSSGGTPLPEGSTVYRLWQPDPMFSEMADAPMRAVLELCEELAILTLVVRARAISRLAGNGILFVPNEITLTPPGGTTVGDEDMTEDPFFAELIKTLLAPIEDQGSASAVSPLLVRGPAEAGKEIRHITVRQPEEAFPENALREQTIKRLGLGLDMPPESLEGVAGANHWGAWQIERDAWRHAEPIARQYVDDMTAAYLYPALIAEGVADPGRYVVAYDASEILTNPDRGADANDAFDRGAIGYEAFRDAMGWPDDAAPEDDEIDMMLLFQGKAAADVTADPASTDAETGAPAQDEPVEPDAPAAPDSSAGADTVAAALLGAAEVAVLRHREFAGAKIRTKANGCEPCKEDINGVANSLVAAKLGYTACVDLGVGDAASLVAGRESLFTMTAERFASPAVAGALALLVEQHAARTLFDPEPPPFPQSTIVAMLSRGAS